MTDDDTPVEEFGEREESSEQLERRVRLGRWVLVVAVLLTVTLVATPGLTEGASGFLFVFTVLFAAVAFVPFCVWLLHVIDRARSVRVESDTDEAIAEREP